MLLKYLKMTLRPTMLRCIPGVHLLRSFRVMRRATIEDKNEVLALNENMYGEMDYLPFYYDSFLKNPVAMPFVISNDSKIIGYMCGFVVDDGETISQRAAIISPKFQGKGYLKPLNQLIIEEARKQYNIQRMAVAVDNDHPYIQSNSFWKMYTLISTKDMFRYMVIPSQLGTCSEFPNILPPESVPVHRVAEYFDTDVIRKYLFPEERIIVNWVPYRLLPSNIALLDEKNTVCVSDVKVSDRIVSGLLSIGTFYTVRQPRYAYTLDIYGTNGNRVRYHLLFHLGFIANKLKDLACLSIVVDKQLDKQTLFDIIAEFGLIKWIASDGPTKTLQYFLESNL